MFEVAIWVKISVYNKIVIESLNTEKEKSKKLLLENPSKM